MMDHRPKPPAAPVPDGRLTRLLQLGGLVSGVAGGMVAEGVRQLFRGALPDPRALLLTPANAARVAERLSHLRGAAMKAGQLLSMETGDVLPPEFSDNLARLRADARPMPLSQVARVLRHAWGEGWEKRFRRFSFTPIAAASIGQVHAAETRDGRHLAIKIQYPGVRRSIDSDVDNLAMLLRLSRLLPETLDLTPLLAEAKRQLHEEADYLCEARHLERYRALLADDPDFVLPSVNTELTTPEVLAMTYLPGEPIDRLASAARTVRDRAAARLMGLAFRELFGFGLVQTDPNFANYLYAPTTGQIGLLDFGAARAYPRERTDACRRLFAAALHLDPWGVAEAAREIGYLGEGDTPAQREAVVRLFLTGFEPARHVGAYDFGQSDLAVRLRDQALALSFDHGFWRAPPPDTAFLHRKLGGLFLLCARLRATIDVGALLEPHLEQA
jgi:predicted unusual protein kinase regulating ubiquinone biosynthesis (AarF/ABC1/UbiB family)